MQLIIGERATGKTTELAKLIAASERPVVIARSLVHAQGILQQANELRRAAGEALLPRQCAVRLSDDAMRDIGQDREIFIDEAMEVLAMLLHRRGDEGITATVGMTHARAVRQVR